MIERCKQIKNCDKIILATTHRKIDDRLVTISKKCGIEVYRGDVNDVLNRYYRCAKSFGLINIVRITGDCPLLDIKISTDVVERFLNSNYDYVRTGHTFPDGLATEIFSFDVLQYASANARLHSEREHVTPYIWKNSDKFGNLTIELENDLSNFRFTVDYMDDLDFIRKVYEKLYPKNQFFGLDTIKDLLKNDNDLLSYMPKQKRYEGYYKSLMEDVG